MVDEGAPATFDSQHKSEAARWFVRTSERNFFDDPTGHRLIEINTLGRPHQPCTASTSSTANLSGPAARSLTQRFSCLHDDLHERMQTDNEYLARRPPPDIH